MNYDAILAIYNCIKDKITYQAPQIVSIKKEVPEDIRKWYEEWKKTKDETNISEITESPNSNLCIYYITPRENDSRVVTNTSDKDKIMEHLISQSREKMVKQNTYNYLSTILDNIEISPFNTEQLDDSSVYECSAISTNKEKIKIDYDEANLETNIIIKKRNKNLKVSMISNLISTHYDCVITSTPNKKKKNNFFDIFKRKSPFELNNQNKAEFITVTKDEVNTNIISYGTIYTNEGVYIFSTNNNEFNLKYYDKESIEVIINTEFDTEIDLNKYKSILSKKQDLANTMFIDKLKNYGILPNINYSIKCNSKELQTLTNKAFIDPKILIKELIQNKKLDK